MDIGDGKFTCTKPDKRGLVKYHCARYLRDNEWHLRRSSKSGERCRGSFWTTLNNEIVCYIEHECNTLFPFAAAGGETTSTTENATAATTTPTAMMTAAVEETVTTEATGTAMNSPVGLGIEDSSTEQTTQTFATAAALISPRDEEVAKRKEDEDTAAKRKEDEEVVAMLMEDKELFEKLYYAEVSGNELSKIIVPIDRSHASSSFVVGRKPPGVLRSLSGLHRI